MKHFVIGTAGHVDHGKTVLVKALTGVETDRLKEEKERGISIELGFAPFKLPSGILAGLVDVPGHERFIKNMLAGVGGIDLVLLVVAADEGVMPQTREHLDIIDLLRINRGVVVITKVDLVDQEWVDMVKEEVRELVGGTVLEDAPVAEVSAVSGRGVKELIELIDRVAGELNERPSAGQARLSVDRVFSMTGFGTVVTGTLIEGQLAAGDTVEILPAGGEARVRGLQVHGAKVQEAEAGQRVAVNLAGIECDDISKGSVLALPGVLKPSHRLDVRLKLLAGAAKSLVNRARVRVHIGTAEILARVVLLEGEELEPGKNALAQLECEEPVVAARGDRLIIRSYSPMHTIAGGTVIDPSPAKHRRLNGQVLEALRTKEKGTPEDLVRQFMASGRQIAFSREELIRGLAMSEDLVNGSISRLTAENQVQQFIVDSKPLYILSSLYQSKGNEMAASLVRYHAAYPLRTGLSKEEIRSKNFTGLSNKAFNSLLEQYQKDGYITLAGENIAQTGFSAGPAPSQAQMFRQMEDEFLAAGFQTPGWDEITGKYRLSKENAEEVMGYFVNSGILVKLDDNILLHRQSMDKAKELVAGFLKENKEMGLGEARDLLNTSRKYALPILTYLDKEKVTRRVEDKRVLY